MSVFDNVKNMGGHIISVLRRLISYEDTEVVDSTTSLNEALLEAVKKGDISKKEALDIANGYVASEKEGKSFSKKQVSGIKADSKNGFEVEDDDKSQDEGKEENVKPRTEKEPDEREL